MGTLRQSRRTAITEAQSGADDRLRFERGSDLEPGWSRAAMVGCKPGSISRETHDLRRGPRMSGCVGGRDRLNRPAQSQHHPQFEMRRAANMT